MLIARVIRFTAVIAVESCWQQKNFVNTVSHWSINCVLSFNPERSTEYTFVESILWSSTCFASLSLCLCVYRWIFLKEDIHISANFEHSLFTCKLLSWANNESLIATLLSVDSCLYNNKSSVYLLFSNKNMSLLSTPVIERYTLWVTKFELSSCWHPRREVSTEWTWPCFYLLEDPIRHRD